MTKVGQEMPKRNERRWWYAGTWKQIDHLQTNLLRNNFFLPMYLRTYQIVIDAKDSWKERERESLYRVSLSVRNN